MRHIISAGCVLTAAMLMVGCGQSGALQLPSDQNFDKRARYLLTSNKQEQVQREKQQAGKADTQQAASELSESK